MGCDYEFGYLNVTAKIENINHILISSTITLCGFVAVNPKSPRLENQFIESVTCPLCLDAWSEEYADEMDKEGES